MHISLKNEISFLDLLGYYTDDDVLYTDNDFLLVYDGKTGNIIGRISCVNLADNNYGVLFDISNNRVSLNNLRVVDEQGKDIEPDLNGTYEFFLDNNSVELIINNGIKLSIKNPNGDFYNFKLDDNHFSFMSRVNIGNAKIHECVSTLVQSNEQKEYEYFLGCKKDFENKKGVSLKIDSLENGKLLICDQILHNKDSKKSFSEVDGSINDAIVMHEDGITAFNRFKEKINILFDTDKDIIDELIDKDNIKEEVFNIFIQGNKDKTLSKK